MATPQTKATTSDSSLQIPLVEAALDQADSTKKLDQSLLRIETFLNLFGFCQGSLLCGVLSWFGFSLIGVVSPVLLTVYSYCSDCEKYQIRSFEIEILASQALTAAISLLFVSHNLRKYGIRKLLFVDQSYDDAAQLAELYILKIRGVFRTLALWVILCFVLKAAREGTRIVYLHQGSWWLSAVFLLASLVTWVYTTTVFLSGTALFNLVGSLQVIRFENYGNLLERDLDVSAYIEEHMRLSHCLSKISHRFRGFLLLEFLVVTGSQFTALLQTTGNKGIINFINGGDFAVLSIVQLVGIVMCLSTAAKVSHRAQALGSVASRWHALVTCEARGASQSGISTNGKNSDPSLRVTSLAISYSESDLESSDFSSLPGPVQLNSSASSYHRRQAFVTYVQSNTGGFTVFGWVIDRILINTIFFVELSLVFFVLGKTISISTR